MTLDMRCCVAASRRCAASLIAAATRSSIISRSSSGTARIELHALRFVLAVHRDLDHAAAGLADDFHGGDLRLRLLHVRLQGLRLLHHVADAAFHHVRLAEVIGDQ